MHIEFNNEQKMLQRDADVMERFQKLATCFEILRLSQCRTFPRDAGCCELQSNINASISSR